MFLSRKPVSITVMPYGTGGLDGLRDELVDLGMDLSHWSSDDGVTGLIKPGKIRAIKKLSCVQTVVRHRPWVDRLTQTLETA